jgi:hypothetical protein
LKQVFFYTFLLFSSKIENITKPNNNNKKFAKISLDVVDYYGARDGRFTPLITGEAGKLYFIYLFENSVLKK